MEVWNEIVLKILELAITEKAKTDGENSQKDEL